MLGPDKSVIIAPIQNIFMANSPFPRKIFHTNDQSPTKVLLKRLGILAFETIKVVLISMAIILPIRYFLIQPFYVEGASMEPNFESNEYLIIDELSYRLKQPVRGEVVVFHYPRNPRDYYIKRVIGLPGETVELIRGRVYINGHELVENYLDPDKQSNSSMAAVELKAGEYFFMGDNRNNSLDSRVFGPVDKRYIVGKVWFRGWPVDRFSFFEQPEY